MPYKKLGFIQLHYGAPYFQAALASVYDQVDRILILYTDYPSQGFKPDHPCPDSQEELMRLASPYWDKITWIHGRWSDEGSHVNAFWDFTEGFDWAWRFDSDEITPPGMVDAMIAQAEKTDRKRFCVPFVHFWRQFGKAMRDGQMPVRLFRVSGGEGDDLYLERNGMEMLHFGYAQPDKYIKYKLQCSGHRPEFRYEWYHDRWLVNAQKDLHPVCFNFWNTEDYDKTTMPECLKRHPYYDLEFIP